LGPSAFCFHRILLNVPSAVAGWRENTFMARLFNVSQPEKSRAERTGARFSHSGTLWWLIMKELLFWKQVFASPEGKANESGQLRHQHKIHRQSQGQLSHCSSFTYYVKDRFLKNRSCLHIVKKF
jgi:hypothetical protein